MGMAVSLGRALCIVVGGGLAGPVGGLIGSLVGGVLPAVLSPQGKLISDVAEGLAGEAVELASSSLAGRLSPGQRELINHDLQSAFRDALREALHDVAGRECFPKVWRGTRDVPDDQVYPRTTEGRRLWHTRDPLAGQVCDYFQHLLRALDGEALLPLDPPAQASAASVYRYLDAETPRDLAAAFYDAEIAPYLDGYGPLRAELPGLGPHLRRHLLDRTLVHLGEFLKARPEAWRAYNRHVLEGLREAMSGQHAEVVEKLEALTRSEANLLPQWADGMADLVTAAGRIEKHLEEGLDTVLQRVVLQHGEVRARFDELLGVGMRVEAKVDRFGAEIARISRILEEGRRREEDAAPVALDTVPAPGEPPFQGLDYYEEDEADRFFGREQLTTRLAGRLRDGARFLAVVGASGSGKSSMVRAGLIPALKRGELLADGTLPPPTSRQWDVRVLTPSARPLKALATALVREAGSLSAAAALADDLGADPRSLDLAVRLALDRSGASHMLLVVDQFEELFTACKDEAERRAFVAALLAAVTPESGTPFTAVIVLRADFYGHCLGMEGLRQALEGSQVLVGAMDAGELRRAIEEPARRGGWEFERGVVELIQRDVGNAPGALPLLSYALLQTWERRRGRTMLLESYLESGGVRGAIAQAAEAVYRGLSPEQQALARTLLLRLTEPGEGTPDTRRRAPLSELLPDAGEGPAAEVLERLTAARLVTTAREPGGSATAEVAHEALIHEWPTLRQWLEEDREWLRLHRRLTEDAGEWARLERDLGALYRGARLAQAVEVAAEHAADLNPLEREFLAASQAAIEREESDREARRRRELEQARALAEEQGRRAEEQARAAAALQRRAVFLGIALLAAAVLMVIALQQWRLAGGERDNARLAEATAVASGATAEAERERAEESLAEARRQTRVAQARALAAQALEAAARDFKQSLLLAWRSVNETLREDEPVLTEAYTALYSTVASERGYSIALGHPDATLSAAFDPTGERVVTAGYDGTARLWNGRTGALLVVLKGHTDAVLSAAFSPDGERVVTASADGTARLWDGWTGAPLLTLEGHTDVVRWAAFSFQGEKVVTAGSDMSARLWDGRTGRLLAVLEGHTAPVISAAFSLDGERLVTASWDGSARLWDTGSGELLATMQGASYDSRSAAFRPDGERVVTASYDDRARLWDGHTGELLITLEGHNNGLEKAAFSFDGERVLTASYDNTARLWDTETGVLLVTLEGHSDAVLSGAFSPAGNQVVTGSRDGTVRLWDAGTGALLLTLSGHTGAVESVAFSPDGGRLLTVGSGDARLWTTKHGALRVSLEGHTGAVTSVAFSPDGARVVTTSEDHTARLWDSETGLIETILKGQMEVVSGAAFSPDGERVVTESNDGFVRLWDGVTGAVLAELGGHLLWAQAAAFSPEGGLLVTLGNESVRLWDARTGAHLADLEEVDAWIHSPAAFSPDGRRLVVAGGDDNTARVWDARSRILLSVLEGHTDLVRSAAFSPDGELLVTASNDGTAKLWDARTGVVLMTLEGRRSEITSPTLSAIGNLVTMASFSPDGKKVVTASLNGVAQLWNAETGALLATLEGHTAEVRSAAFSPDGKRVVTASADETARVWDVQTGALLAILEGYTSNVRPAAFSPDGKWLAGASAGYTAQLWDISLDGLLAEARRQLLPMLTLEECKQFLPDDCPPEARAVPLQ